MSVAFPGYVSDVHSADALDPAWGNAIRDRALQIFDTTVNRDAAVTVPQVGQTGVITTGTGAGLYTYAGATDKWVAPWNLPWGLIASASATSAQTGITTEVDVTSITVTFVPVANRQYRVEALIALSGTSGDTARGKITDSSAVVKNDDQVTFGVSASQYKVNPWVLETYTAVSTTRKARVLRQAGAGGTVTVASSATQPSTLYVVDMGPSGAPA